MQPRESPADIIALDDALEDLADGLKISFGSVCRVASRYLQNYGITVTPQNVKFIEGRSLMSYMGEWAAGKKGGGAFGIEDEIRKRMRQQEAATAQHHAIEKAIIKAAEDVGTDRRGNKTMNGMLAEIAAPVIEAMLDRHPDWNHFSILDMGAGEGDTTLALLNVMKAQGLDGLRDRCEFYALEPSEMKAAVIGEKLREHGVMPDKRTIVSGSFQSHMWKVRDGCFDMVISTAVLHHMTTPGYLDTLKRKLTDEGVLVIADWYTSVWSQPAFVAAILEDLGMKTCQLAGFRELFDVRPGDYERHEAMLDGPQRAANAFMRRYLVHLYNEMAGLDPNFRLGLFEAHQTFAEHRMDVHNAGFVTGDKELKDKHAGFVREASEKATVLTTVYPANDIAQIYAAAKIRPPEPKPEKPRNKGLLRR